mmetsp:Transcript_7041/g.13493  ORF Transcript_7041/g.13493 Transcript_7041/m.13493 type:complete len:117 (+) Transcript_7041:608-958(+)
MTPSSKRNQLNGLPLNLSTEMALCSFFGMLYDIALVTFPMSFLSLSFESQRKRKNSYLLLLAASMGIIDEYEISIKTIQRKTWLLRVTFREDWPMPTNVISSSWGSTQTQPLFTTV